jgi:dienelactone hydrolase
MGPLSLLASSFRRFSPGTLCIFWVATLSFDILAKTPWDLKRLSQPPKVHAANAPQADSMRAIFYDGLPWKKKATRVFAFYGVPARKGADRLPAMILVHGGDGTAFADWVKLWNDRGYAAIAMDTCGSVPSKGYGEPGGADNRPRHNFSGPPGWNASFEQVDWPVEDQWAYHAVADILLANSLLRSFPEIDPERIGITGISWGGYLASIAASVDRRFRFAIPVYGCGFLGADSYWVPDFAKMGSAKSSKWLGLWDPSVYLGRAKMPFLWVSGTNDFAYPMDSLQKSYRLPRTTRTLVIRVRMEHGQTQGATPEEIHAFADKYLKSGASLASIGGQGLTGRRAWVKYTSTTPVIRAELNYTLDSGVWEHRRWQTMAADLDHGRSMASAPLPEGVKVHYFNLIEQRGLIVSSEHATVYP